MKEEVFILIVDDVNQEANIRALELRLRKFCTPRIEYVHTGAIDLRKDDGSGHLDSDKLKNRLEEKLKGGRIDWIATDFNLGEAEIDGIDVIRIMSMIRRFKCKNIILYSGNIQRAIRKIINESKANDTEDAIVESVEKFIDLPILKFDDRHDYQESLVDIISKNNQPSMEERLVKLLHTHENMIFSSCFPPFTGKTFGEIAKIIEDDSDARSYEWQQGIIDQIIAYLVEVNE